MTEQDYMREMDFIFNRFPSYQQVGGIAYKPGIETMQRLDEMLGHPHRSFRSIHVAGTNGKGSTSHMLAALSTASGLRTGLYTSPHLVDFRERIRVDGVMADREFVYDFIVRHKKRLLEAGASFFEITTALAFAWFAEQKADVAVIECGLGGRLDSTNIIEPQMCVITNIGLDHCEHLGYSLPEIAREKAGIIKPGIPAVIGEGGEPSVKSVFIEKARSAGAPILFADELLKDAGCSGNREKTAGYVSGSSSGGGIPQRIADAARGMYGALLPEKMDLRGACQEKNLKTVCLAWQWWRERNGEGVPDDFRAEEKALRHAARTTGLRGRWETLCESPKVVCDTGHNAHGFALLGPQILRTARQYRRLFLIFGVVADKDLKSIEAFLPDKYVNAAGEEHRAYYYFVNAAGSRALPAEVLAGRMQEAGFCGEACLPAEEGGSEKAETVTAGIGRCLAQAGPEDLIFIGGSTFVVAEALKYRFL